MSQTNSYSQDMNREGFAGEEFEMNRGGVGGVGIGGSRSGTLVETRPLSLSNRSIDREENYNNLP